jgi:DNA-3-methyladenine glycosylase
MIKLPPSFYERDDVVLLARELLGKILVTAWDGVRTTGRIVETEAYAGLQDKASHAYRGKTPRTEVMFETGGTAYVYLCYGLHQMFNIVTAKKEVPHAVLIRAVAPLEGIGEMLERTGKKQADASLTRGPWQCRQGVRHAPVANRNILAKRCCVHSGRWPPGAAECGRHIGAHWRRVCRCRCLAAVPVLRKRQSVCKRPAYAITSLQPLMSQQLYCR